ncbi:hypothetical protein PFICI_02203 [Pestalotiopsis fici W106-1]|uniref:Uncharacterized protein n=1 Tax=Pestalotiopsis fici (strain W106-1 / CGMCC3.15140) TaxID=1229662 RepID=W3XDK3_PESFW|nr:uncharacterized protein PFICI_02203 [Pestalotiopsis fici W106-1]ETS84178.1 hypothetical protein PFICI_02203 [Pestalotiopsis fici W106-1]
MATQASSALSPPTFNASALKLGSTSTSTHIFNLSRPSVTLPGLHFHSSLTPATSASTSTTATNVRVDLAIAPFQANDDTSVPDILQEAAHGAIKEQQDPDDHGRVDPKSGLNNCEIAGIVIGCILIFILLVYLGIKFLIMWEIKEYAKWERENVTIRDIRRWLNQDDPVPARFQQQMKTHFSV